MSRTKWVIAAGLACCAAWAFACDSDTGLNPAGSSDNTSSGATDPSASSGDPTAGQPYTGTSQGGPIPQASTNDAGDYVPPPITGIDADTPCCNVTLSIPDADGNETTHLLGGDSAPLNGAGVPLTYANGAWSATVCLPLDTQFQYTFYFGNMLVDDSGSDASVADQRVNPTLPTTVDQFGNTVNVFSPVAMCSDIDASTGSSAH